MLRRNKILSKFIMGIFITSSTVLAVPQGAFAAYNRLSGQTRYETSADVSEKNWTTSSYVVLASGEGYADALCAAPIAKKYNAPILLTESKILNTEVKNEIIRLKASNVIEIGGEAAISSDIENELKSMKLDVQRLGGQNRFETSVIAARFLGTINKVAVTSGYGYADALSMASIAASQGIPILLTGKDILPSVVQDYIDEKKASINNSYVIGGQGVISDSVVSNLPAAVRISGQNRFDTNVKVLSYFKGSIDFNKVYVVKGDGPTGNEFADALSGSAAAAKTSSPIILTYNTLYPETESFIKSNVPKTASVTAVGGISAVPESLLTYVEKVVSGTPASSDENVSSVLTKLKVMNTSSLNDKEKTIVSDIITALSKYEADSSYDLSSDSKIIKQHYDSLSSSEKSSFQSAILASGVTFSEILILQSKFGL